MGDFVEVVMVSFKIKIVIIKSKLGMVRLLCFPLHSEISQIPPVLVAHIQKVLKRNPSQPLST